jgi:hypothetical protein
MLLFNAMTIAEAREKCKTLITSVPRDVLIVAILILASCASFGFGYLTGSAASTSSGQGSEITFDESSTMGSTSSPQAGQFVASKNGTKYYLSSCAGANKISDANKIYFVSASAAEAAGYSPAANCKGL